MPACEAGLKSCFTVSAKQVAAQSFGMNGTFPLAVFSQPNRGVACFERKLLAFDEQMLGYLISDPRNPVGKHPDLQAPFIQFKVLEHPLRMRLAMSTVDHQQVGVHRVRATVRCWRRRWSSPATLPVLGRSDAA